MRERADLQPENAAELMLDPRDIAAYRQHDLLTTQALNETAIQDLSAKVDSLALELKRANRYIAVLTVMLQANRFLSWVARLLFRAKA